MTGFEPATPSSRTKCATGLRYIPQTQNYYVCVRFSIKTANIIQQWRVQQWWVIICGALSGEVYT